LGVQLPGPFWVTGHVNTNPYAVQCWAGGVTHVNAMVASRCRDCQLLSAEYEDWAESPGGQQWLAQQAVITDRKNRIVGIAVAVVGVLILAALVLG
jgi:hypothetical protein